MGQDAHVLVWDGGIYPTMYLVSGRQRSVERVATLFRLFGNAYAQFARSFPPFRDAAEHGVLVPAIERREAARVPGEQLGVGRHPARTYAQPEICDRAAGLAADTVVPTTRG